MTPSEEEVYKYLDKHGPLTPEEWTAPFKNSVTEKRQYHTRRQSLLRKKRTCRIIWDGEFAYASDKFVEKHKGVPLEFDFVREVKKVLRRHKAKGVWKVAYKEVADVVDLAPVVFERLVKECNELAKFMKQIGLEWAEKTVYKGVPGIFTDCWDLTKEETLQRLSEQPERMKKKSIV